MKERIAYAARLEGVLGDEKGIALTKTLSHLRTHSYEKPWDHSEHVGGFGGVR
jgi:hypothetical protein